MNIPMNSTNFLEQRIKNKRINCEKSTELWEFAIIIMQFFSSVLCCGISISFVHTSETASSFLLFFFSIYGAKTPQDVGNWINTNEKKTMWIMENIFLWYRFEHGIVTHKKKWNSIRKVQRAMVAFIALNSLGFS